MTDRTAIERVVMRRVRRIRVLRAVFSSGMLAAAIGALALWGIGREVWVARVLENMPGVSDPAVLFQFWFTAFTETQLVVQALSLATLASLLYLARAMARLLSSVRTPARV